MKTGIDGEVYLSLFEFLGYPAGKELGTKVFKEAYDKSIKVQYQDIDSAGYKGRVVIYPTSFLQTNEALRA